MGFLSDGKTLKWNDSRPYLMYIKKKGIQQFLDIYLNLPKEKKCNFRFGDEIEYSIFTLDHSNKTISVSLDAAAFIEQLKELDHYIWHPEYSNYMIEGTPKVPYDCTIGSLLRIEQDLISRRDELRSLLSANQVAITLTSFPRLGCSGSSPISSGNEPTSQSSILSDAVIGDHIRFHTLTENIRLRRQSKVNIQVPIYQDKNTGSNLKFIQMDCMCFGMGCSCLQETFQTQNEADARYLYDQLAVISPILLAMTAASPAYNGYLSDVDCRWNIIADSVDDRPVEERLILPKSRYSSISFYVGDGSDVYNDFQFNPNEEVNQLVDGVVDPLLAQHLNYLFIRDPLVIYEKGLPVDSISSEGTIQSELLDKYENIHSTNWNTVRLKVPVPEVCGWRVEFRPMELQASDKDNSAFLILMSILARAIIYYKLEWYIPISLLDENMARAQKRDSVLNQVFYFKRNGYLVETTIDDIINGEDGILQHVHNYVSEMKGTEEEKETVRKYLEIIKNRASGSSPTDAKRIRNFVTNHPKYEHDSLISNEICYDMVQNIFL